MKLLQEITLKRSVYDPDFRGPRLIGRENDPPVIRTNEFEPDFLVFRNGSWQILTSCHQDTPDTLWYAEPSPHGILLSQLKAGESYNCVVQDTFLDPLSGTPRFPSLVGLSVWEYLSDGTLLCEETGTQEFVCTSLEGTLLWRSSVFWQEGTHISHDQNYIYFQQDETVRVFTLQGKLIDSFSLPPDLAPLNFWLPHLSFSADTLRIEGLNRDNSRYMAWNCTGDSICTQVLFDLSSLPEIMRLEARGPNVLLISSLFNDQHPGIGTQCCLLSDDSRPSPVSLLSYWEPEPLGAEIFWLDDETFVFVRDGRKHSYFYVYSIQGECLVDKTDLPGLLWMESLFSSNGLLYIQTYSSTDNGKTLLYHFSVYQI